MAREEEERRARDADTDARVELAATARCLELDLEAVTEVGRCRLTLWSPL
jgi:hypothetical protein